MEKLTEGYGLVEGPTWDPDRGLIFSDVLNGGVFCIDHAGKVSTLFEHRRGIGGISLHQDGGLIVSGRNISYKSFDGGPTLTVLDRDEDNGNVGYNDITTDALGRIYAGSLGASPVFADGREPQSGDLYMIDLDGNATIVGHDIRLTNGLGFSPDGKTLYHSDTGRSTVHQYPVNADGTLGEKGDLVVFENGAPDGLCVAQNGDVYVALARNGYGVAVVSSSGEIKNHIKIPQPMCTSVCFGGEDMMDLYVVSGSDGMPTDKAGAVYKTRTSVPGLVVPVARVALG